MKNLFGLLAIVIVFSSCDDMKVFQDYDKDVDFKQYKTYAFLPMNEESSKMVSTFGKNKLFEYITLQLGEYGYKHSFNVESADIAINVFVVIDQKTGTRAYTNYYGVGGYGSGYHYGNYGYGGGMATTTYENYTIKNGSLLVDMFDNKTKNLIWQGGASGTIDQSTASRERAIKMIIQQLYRNFPIDNK